MAMVGAITSQNVKSLEQFEKQKANYEKSHAEWLKGRNIQKIEQEARDTLLKAKQEAEKIIKAAHDQVKDAEENTKATLELKAQAEGSLQSARKKESEAELMKSEASALKRECETLKQSLTVQLNKANELEQKAKAKLDDIRASLQRLIDG